MLTRLALLILLTLPVTTSGSALGAPSHNFLIHNGDRVDFYGDSITDREWYPTLLQTFVLTRYPTWRNQFINRGQSGDPGADLERFQRDVVGVKPDVLTYMMGYNDGGYRPFTSSSLETFLGNVHKSVDMLRGVNPKARILLMSSTPSETAVSSDNRWVAHEWYPYHMLMYSQNEGRLAQKLDVSFVDLTTLYGQTLGLGKVVGGDGFQLSRDGVHPKEEGQSFIAFYALKGLDVEPILADVGIDAAKANVTQTKNCKVTGLTVHNGSITFSRVCDSLPYPTPEVARPFSFLVQLDDTINDDRLTISGLTAPSYALSIDGQHIADIPASALADGINLSQFPDTPMYKQAMTVFQAVRAKDMLDCDYWRTYITTGKADPNGKPIGEQPEAVAAQQKLKAATDYCYTLNVPQPHTVKLEPLTTPIPRYHDLETTDLNEAFLDMSMTPATINWNDRSVIDGAIKVDISNSDNIERTGTIEWDCPAGWSVKPRSSGFTVPPGKSVDVPFAVSNNGPAPLDLPVAKVRWHWSSNWAYPMSKMQELDTRPRWTVNKSKTPVSVDGNLDDWADASSFTLDNVHYIDTGFNGKRALWNGPTDLSAQWYTKWDDKNLYVAAVVHDDDHIQNEADWMMWSQDMVQVAAYTSAKGQPDGRYELGFGAYPDHDAVVTYIAQPTILPSAPPIAFKSALNNTAHTCTYEIAIPWERLAPFTPAMAIR